METVPSPAPTLGRRPLRSGRVVGGPIALLAALLLAASAHAISFDPGGGYHADGGARLFRATGPQVQFREMVDTPGRFRLDHEWGFYYRNDPGLRVPVFDTSDDDRRYEQAKVDFDVAAVFDLDGSEWPRRFTPRQEDFGFYVSVRGAGGDVTVFSDPSLNSGGVDHAGHFVDRNRPGESVVAFEVGPHTISILSEYGLGPAAVAAATPPRPTPGTTPGPGVPEPGAALLMALGFTLIGARLRAAR